MGLGMVAVFSEADRLSPHVTYADEAYLIGPPPPLESYLDIGRMIEAARKSGADAIHPGYGFIAENAEFAEACVEAGITFIGPSGDMIRRMGDKLEARRIMQAAGVPIVPGATVEATSIDETMRQARGIGFPVLVKPASGGGGKGMHVVNSEEQMESVLRMAASEAASSFGNATVYLEKYLNPVRHIEIQILRDNFGNVLHMGERECSVQRRHQKIIEECPSVAVTPDLRGRMVAAAIAAVNAVNYSGVGTIEFLLDAKGDFYFLEMNTRLQVEHTVTEEVTGLDLVQEQILVASGQPLSLKQEDIQFSGWAIECRISAEDPYNNFMPSPGRISVLSEPGGPGIRVDSGVSEGFEIPLFYDPMIAKLITWGRTRDQAISRMRRALRDYRLLGIHHNIPFLLAIIQHVKFKAGELQTQFLDENEDLFEQQPKTGAKIAAVVAAVLEHQSKSTRLGAAKAAAGANGLGWKGSLQGSSWDRPWR
jgi:acetyl-CoA carboxylase biotin carboxylase subunit